LGARARARRLARCERDARDCTRSVDRLAYTGDKNIIYIYGQSVILVIYTK
jgi:hypothetical protein